MILGHYKSVNEEDNGVSEGAGGNHEPLAEEEDRVSESHDRNKCIHKHSVTQLMMFKIMLSLPC